MTTTNSPSQPRYSWEEYKKEFYPSQAELEVAEASSPYEFGTKLAEKALDDLRSTLAHLVQPIHESAVR